MPAPDWKAVRAGFPGLANKIFLDAACLSLAPARARAAVLEMLDAVVLAPTADATERHILLDDARRRAAVEAAALIGASPEEIALVESTTHGLSLTANGLDLSGGDNVVLCDLEFVGVGAPWAARAREAGFDVRFVRTKGGRVEVQDVAAAIDASTKVVCLSSVQWASGHRLDLAALSDLARERGVLLVIDAIHHLGALPLDVRRTPVDVIACGGHKWLNAPFGCGFLYVRRELWPRLRPSLWGYLNLEPPEGGWGTYFATPEITPVRRYEFVTEARKLETGGTGNYPGAAGLTASLAMINEIGPEAIEARIRSLVARLIGALDERGFRLVSPREPEARSGIVVFTPRGDAAQDARIVRRLLEKKICISQRYTSGIGGLRASVHFFNDEDDVDVLATEAAAAREVP